MSISVMPERAPYVQFEIRAIENRSATIKEGCYKVDNIDFALITPAGSKDTVERRVDEWIQDIDARLQAEQMSPTLANHFKQLYELWKKGQEMPLSGTPVRGWPPISPAEQEMILQANVHTVEDLASANEATIMRIGMGGRALAHKAVAWLTSAHDHGKIAQEVAALKVDLEEKTRLLDETTSALQKANALIEQLQPAKGKRAA